MLGLSACPGVEPLFSVMTRCVAVTLSSTWGRNILTRGLVCCWSGLCLCQYIPQNTFQDAFQKWKKIVGSGVSRAEGSTLRETNLINPLNPELNPICYLLALLGAHHFLHVSRIRVKLLTFRRLMS